MKPIYIDPSQPLVADLERTLRTHIAVDELVFHWHRRKDDGHISVLLITEDDLRKHAKFTEAIGLPMGCGRCLTFAKAGAQWSLENVSKWIA